MRRGALSETQPVMKTSRVHSPVIWDESHPMSLQHDYMPRPRGFVPLGIPNKSETAGQRSDVCGGGIVVLRRALTESEWDKVRAFVRRTSRESLRLRFGQTVDFADDRTLKRFFDIEGVSGEMIWMLEEGGAICAVAHLVRLSPANAEIALIVRSDRARRGVGEKLLRATLARAARQGLHTLNALVLHENTAMLRLARKVGFEAQKSSGLTVELEFDLGQILNVVRDTGAAPVCAGAPIDSIEATMP
jgi:RimJ/RimL family protein N-acetyltransferase